MNQRFTVFAPTNEAFAKIPVYLLDPALVTRQKLVQVLLNHVVGRKLNAVQVTYIAQTPTHSGPLKMLCGLNVKVIKRAVIS